MSGNIIAITQQKGGAGKTTLAALLATGAAEAGRSVLCLDIDPQGSLTMWGRLRQEQSPTLLVSVEAAAGHRVRDVAERARRDYDLVLIDAPPHAETETRQAIRAATLVLTPMQPSPLDLWATKPVVDAAQVADRPVRLILNRVPPRSKLTDGLITASQSLGVELLANQLGARVAFPSAMARGLTALETEPRGRAAAESLALTTEIFALLRSI
jgi:chromosome partitioning protein